MILSRMRPKTIVSRVFISIIIVLIVLNMLVAASMFVASQNLILTSAHNTNMALLQSQATAYRQILANQTQFAQLLYNSLSVKQLMSNSALTPYDLYVNYFSVNNMVIANDYIFSVYVFNSKARTVYVMGQGACIRSFDEFYDQAFLTELIEASPARLSNDTPLVRTITVPKEIQLVKEDQIGEVYSVVMGQYASTADAQLGGALVVNLYASHQLLTSSGQSGEGTYFSILDSAGRVVSSTKEGQFLNLWSDRTMYTQALSGEESGSYVATDEAGERVIITFLRLAGYDRTLISTAPYAQFASQIGVLGTSTALIVLSILALGLLASVALSRKIVKPFSTFFSQISGPYVRTDSTRSLSYDDLHDFALHTVEQYTRLTDLEQYQLQNAAYLKEYRLRNLLERPDADIAELDMGIAHGEPADGLPSTIDVSKPVCFAYMLVDGGQEARLNDYVLERLIAEAMPEVVAWELITLARYRWLLVYQLPEGMETAALTQGIIAQLREIQLTVRNTFGQRVAIALKTDIADAAYWHPAMRQVEKRIEQRYLLGYDTVIMQGQPFDPDWEMKPFIQGVNQVRKIMLEGEAGELDTAWDEMCAALQMASVPNARKAVDILSSSLFITLMNMRARDVAHIAIDYAEVAQRAEGADTLQEALSILRLIPRAVFDRTETKLDRRNEEIAGYAIDYIAQHLDDPGLNYAMVADQLRISGAQLKRVFRLKTGESLSTYIRDLRLRRAEEALVGTALPIEEILDTVGWENKKYFFTVFKQVHGITPSEYRLRMNMNEGRENP